MTCAAGRSKNHLRIYLKHCNKLRLGMHENVTKRNYNWYYFFFVWSARRSMRNGAMTWDGIYGIIHMAWLPWRSLQLWILISALCERRKFLLHSTSARNWLPFSTTKKNISSFLKLLSLFHFVSFHCLLLISLSVSCNATFISFLSSSSFFYFICEKKISHMFPYITSEKRGE